ncbi:HAAS signaling domain-containing protein [Sediminibacillus halophilus]|uniref:Uncharacterized membrane protein n=1 Tax=Sediminibacillus halophilus TaxID=482461 RepID=A0A1G9VGL6_9BACI|nr:DUF1700 domain-containing protein [Sediminibacillus halophilus]SDM71279.1 Uncharacterized membrane protein [Sediminibacillus halophilus]
MTKEIFLKEIDKRLKSLSNEEREEILFDFKEHIDAALSEGRDEQEIVEGLGNPAAIAKELQAEASLKIAEQERSITNIGRAVMAIISVSLINLLIVLGPALGMLALYIGLYGAAAVLSLSPLVFLFKVVFLHSPNLLFDFFVSITMGSFGVLCSIGLWRVGKWLYRLLIRYMRFNFLIMKGDGYK